MKGHTATLTYYANRSAAQIPSAGARELDARTYQPPKPDPRMDNGRDHTVAPIDFFRTSKGVEL